MKTIIYLTYFLFFCTATGFAQEITEQDSTETGRWEAGVDMISRYIWRGQSWGGSFFAAQPSINFAASEKLTIGVWATTNFQKDYFYDESMEENKGYQEFDLGMMYQFTDFFSIELWDYYWPASQEIEGVDRSYFNYGPDGVKSVDASLILDFSDGYRIPVDATISTLIAGNDYRYDEEGENPKQNFTTYIEAGYTVADLSKYLLPTLLKNVSLHPSAGVVLNNQAEYYTYGDYDRPSLINLAVSASREFDLGSGITMPLTVNYTHNAATANTQFYGRDFVTAGISFWYKG